MTTPSQPNDELDKAIELLPCPFCGETPVLKMAGKTNYWWVGCEIHLEPNGKGCGVGHSSYDKQEAVSKWNNQFAAKRSKELERENAQFEVKLQDQYHVNDTLRTAYKQALKALTMCRDSGCLPAHISLYVDKIITKT